MPINSLSYSPRINFQAKKEKENPNEGNIKNGFIGLAADMAVNVGAGLGAGYLSKRMTKAGAVETADSKAYTDAFQRAFEKSDAGKNGISAIFVNDEASAKKAEEAIKNAMEDKKALRFYPKSLRKDISDQSAKTLAKIAKDNGNAFTTADYKTVITGEKLSPLSFQQLGHAVNYNTNKFIKAAAKAKAAQPFILIPSLAISLFNKPKAETPEHKLSAWDKTTNFIRKNVAGLVMLSWLPTLVGEGAASIKGVKLAKELLKPEQLKKVKKAQALGFASYVAMAVGASVAAHVAVKVKDHFQAKQDGEI